MATAAMWPSVTPILLMPIVSAAAAITPTIRSNLPISLPLLCLPVGEEVAGRDLIPRAWQAPRVIASPTAAPRGGCRGKVAEDAGSVVVGPLAGRPHVGAVRPEWLAV